MNRRNFLKTTAALATGAAASFMPEGLPETPERPKRPVEALFNEEHLSLRPARYKTNLQTEYTDGAAEYLEVPQALVLNLNDLVRDPRGLDATITIFVAHINKAKDISQIASSLKTETADTGFARAFSHNRAITEVERGDGTYTAQNGELVIPTATTEDKLKRIKNTLQQAGLPDTVLLRPQVSNEFEDEEYIVVFVERQGRNATWIDTPDHGIQTVNGYPTDMAGAAILQGQSYQIKPEQVHNNYERLMGVFDDKYFQEERSIEAI